jgi:membrane dipeptidase
VISTREAGTWAKELGISREAVELYLSSAVVDLHLDSFIWARIFGYDLARKHERAPLGGWFLGHADFPRVREAGLSAATWVITTNPLRDPSDRFDTLLRNLSELEQKVAELPDDLVWARSFADYERARALGKHAVFVGIQGGNALDGPDDAVERLPRDSILRVTLVHLSSSRIGVTSSPLGFGGSSGLSNFGKRLVERLDARKILIDLAHIAPDGFWDALDVHDPGVPAVVTHTGVSGVYRHWRNLDDSQLRAIADTHGLVGILFHRAFLGRGPFRATAERVVDHLAHVVRVAGEDSAAIGSDFDGAIMPPRDLSSVLDFPRLVELMLKRGFSHDLVRKILGQNFLRVLSAVRG